MWGANPSASAPHAHDNWLPESPGRVIVVDPIRTPTAAAADLHLQPFPGSDAALAFALMHVIVREGMADRDLLVRARRRLGRAGTDARGLHAGVGRGRDRRAGGADRGRRPKLRRGAVAAVDRAGAPAPAHRRQRDALGSLLPAVSGNLAKPGAGFLYLNDRRERDESWLAATHLGEPPPSRSATWTWPTAGGPERSRALVCWNINIAASNPQQARLRRALARDDLFTVVLDLFATDTLDLADFVLPAASFLEFDDLVASYFDLTLSAQVKAVEPPGEALPNQEIFRRLAAAMGFTSRSCTRARAG